MQKLTDGTDILIERRKKPRPSPVLARKIREVLISMGGEAHRSDVIATLARENGLDSRRVPEELQAKAIVSFEKAWRSPQQREALGFHLRFGEGSHRWAVREEAH